MLVAQDFEYLHYVAALVRFASRGRVDQAVRHPAHGGNNGHHRAVSRRVAHNLPYSRDARAVADGSAAKLHHSQWFFHSDTQTTPGKLYTTAANAANRSEWAMLLAF